MGRKQDTHKIGTLRSKTAGSTSVHVNVSIGNTFGGQKPYGVSPHRRQKQDLVAQLDVGINDIFNKTSYLQRTQFL